MRRRGDVRLPTVVHVLGGGWVACSRGLDGPIRTVAEELLARDIRP